jgi:hypothetical protein
LKDLATSFYKKRIILLRLLSFPPERLERERETGEEDMWRSRRQSFPQRFSSLASSPVSFSRASA